MTNDSTRILVVEDDRNIIDLVQANLLVRGFDVVVSPTGDDAVELLDSVKPDLVLLDLMLPRVDGFDLCREIRGDSTVGIIVVSARRGEQDKVRALNLGADDYLTKPFSFVVLLARIRALLRRGVQPRPAALTVDDLVLDPAAHTVKRGETPIDLTPREFSLLEFLMRRAGDAVSKADILHHVWDANYEGDANVVEVYVGYLRRKIDTPFNRQTVQTVRGAGYRLTADSTAS